MGKGKGKNIEIRIRGLYKALEDQEVLNGVDLDVQSGEILALVGMSGCGKTVLLNHILGRIIPDHGTIEVINHHLPDKPLVNLRDAGAFELDDIRRHWGVVFQGNALFSGSVYDNIALWLREVKNMDEASIRPISRRALAAVGLPDTPDFLGRPHEKLSGGMAKRLAVARALAMNPEVIFYDEPTTGLDPVSAAQIHQLMYDTHLAMPGRTSIIVTHDRQLLSRLRPRTIMLDQGQVFFDGTFDDFEASSSEIILPYFEIMPLLHDGRARERQVTANTRNKIART